MKTETKYSIMVIAAIVIILAIPLTIFKDKVRIDDELMSLGDASSCDTNNFRIVSTSTGISIGTSSTSVISTTTARSYIGIVNNGSNDIYLSLLNGAAATSGQGIYLRAGGGSFELTACPVYFGAITAVSASTTAGSSITLTEGKLR